MFGKKIYNETIKYIQEADIMINTMNRLDELKKIATTLIKLDAVSRSKRRLSKMIMSGIDDIFVVEQADDVDIDEYLRTRALDYWFYTTMDVEKLVPQLASQIDEKWEIQNGDDQLVETCLETVMAYHPVNLKTNLGDFLKSDPATADLATVDGFDIDQINQILVERDIRAVPTNRSE